MPARMTPDAARLFLGVDAGADEAQLKSARRQQAKLLHPDRFPAGDDGSREAAHVQMQKVNEAYDVLLAELRAGRGSAGAPGPGTGSRPSTEPSESVTCAVCSTVQDVPVRDAYPACSDVPQPDVPARLRRLRLAGSRVGVHRGSAVRSRSSRSSQCSVLALVMRRVPALPGGTL